MKIQQTRTHLWPIVLLVLVVSTIYLNSLNVPFHFDDKANIHKPALKIEALNSEQFIEALSDTKLTSRPISNLSFAFNYFVGGYRVQGYHLVNIGIHVGAGIFLYLLLHLTLNLTVNANSYKKPSTIALMASLLWLANPVATQSVTYIVQRMNSMAAMFFILAILLYAIGRNRQLASKSTQGAFPNWAWFAGSALAGLMAIGSKEIAATLPFFVFLYEWYFFQNLRWQWIKKKLYWLVGVVFVMVLITYFYTKGDIVNQLFSVCSQREFTTWERVLTQFRVVIYYISLIFYPNPNRLTLDYDFPVSVSLISPLSTLFSFLAIAALIALAIYIARRERFISFCILWFFGTLVIESSVICLELVFEHRTYLPSMFLLALFVAMTYRIRKYAFGVSVVLVATTILFSYWAIERNKDWQSTVSLWTDAVAKYPNKARSHSNLGLALMEAGEDGRAEQEFRRALEIDPKAEVPHNNLASLLLKQGKREEAEFHLNEAVRIKPQYVAARINLGRLKRENGLYQEAVVQFRQALHKDAIDPLGNKNLGNALLRSGQPADALPYLEKADLQDSPDPEVLLDIGESMSRLGRTEEAISVYKKVLNKDKNIELAHYHLAILYKQKGLEKDALRHYREADRLMRQPPTVKYDFANLLFRQGELQEAEKVYKDFLAISPTVAMASNNMGLVLVNQGRVQEAIQRFQAAVNIAPSFKLAADNMRLASEQLLLLNEQQMKKENEK